MSADELPHTLQAAPDAPAPDPPIDLAQARVDEDVVQLTDKYRGALIPRMLIRMAITLVLFAVAGIFVLYKFALPNVRHASTLNLVHDVQEATARFHRDHGEIPQSAPELFAALKGENIESRDYLPVVRPGMLHDGAVIDLYGTPLQVIFPEPSPEVDTNELEASKSSGEANSPAPAQLPIVSSAGADLEHGTADDVSDTNFREVFKKYGLFVQPEAPVDSILNKR